MRGATYAGYAPGSSGAGSVVSHGGLFAFCTQPDGGFTTRGSSEKSCVSVQTSPESSPGRVPATSCHVVPGARRGTRPVK